MFSEDDPAKTIDRRPVDENDDMNPQPFGDGFLSGEFNRHKSSAHPTCSNFRPGLTTFLKHGKRK